MIWYGAGEAKIDRSGILGGKLTRDLYPKRKGQRSWDVHKDRSTSDGFSMCRRSRVSVILLWVSIASALTFFSRRSFIRFAIHHEALSTSIDKMAEPGKQATVYIVDVGSSTGDCNNGRMESDLDYGMKYVWEKIAGILAANRVGLGVGVLGLRTDETNNPLDSDEDYINIGWLPRRNCTSLCSFALRSMNNISNFMGSRFERTWTNPNEPPHGSKEQDHTQRHRIWRCNIRDRCCCPHNREFHQTEEWETGEIPAKGCSCHKWPRANGWQRP
jgi:hypothetical protein